MSDSVQNKARFDIVRYANCWEDADILVEALAVKPGDTVLSIASAGDNALALLCAQPAAVYACDISSVQLACLAIRVAAFRELDHDGMLVFLGFRGGCDSQVRKERLANYHRMLRRHLDSAAVSYWDAHQDDIAGGVIHQGRFETYFTLFRTRVMPFIHRSRTIQELLKPKTPEERRMFYRQHWDTWAWRLLFHLFFSRFVMGRLGRSPAFFDQVIGSVAARIMDRARHALSELPTDTNPCLHYILTGSFGEALPRYARKEHFLSIRSALDRLHLIQGTTDDALRAIPRPLNACNLSDIFEYMDPAAFQACSSALLRHCACGARLAYWNMLVPRCVSTLFPECVHTNQDLSTRMHLQDKAFFYQAFFLDEVCNP